MSNFNKEQGTIALLAKNSLPQPVHHWKLNELDALGLDSIEYASGTDENLTNPEGSYDQNGCFIPMINSGSGEMLVMFGENSWVVSGVGVGPDKTIWSAGSGSYGTLFLDPSGGSWGTFATNTFNGVQRIWFPKLASNDKLGGYVDFYYYRDAFYTAFNGNTSVAIITLDGSVYKGSIFPANLVVTVNGIRGPAGGGVLDTGSAPVNGVNNGALVGQDGFRGKCYDFNGSSHYIQCATSDLPTGSTPRTISVWFKPSAFVGYASVLSYGAAIADQIWTIYSEVGGDLHLTVYGTTITVSAVLTVDAWHQVTSIYDGTTIKLYLNGENVGRLVRTISTASSDLFIGRFAPLSQEYFNGKIQDVRILDSALSDDEVKQLYQDTRYIISVDSIPAPIHKVPLDKSFVEEVGDYTSNMFNTSAILNIDDIKKSYKFNGSAYIRGQQNLHASLQGANPKTLCAWVKIGTFTSDAHIASFGTYTAGTQFDISTLAAGGGDQFSFHGNNADITETTARQLNTWYHVCATYDGTTIRLYVDASVVGSLIIALNTGIGPLRIGERADGGGTKWAADGCIADVRVYNICLTIEQIQIVMNDRESFELKIDEKTSLIKSSVNGDASSEIAIHQYEIGDVREPEGLVLHNRLGNPYQVQNSILGGSGYSLGTVSYPSGKFNTGLYSDAVGGWVNFSDALPNLQNYLTEAFCIEFWMKPDWALINGRAQITTPPYPFAIQEAASANFIAFYPGSTGSDTAFSIRYSGTTRNVINTTMNWDADTWHHIACVMNKNGIDGTSDTMRLYVDGVDEGSLTDAIGSFSAIFSWFSIANHFSGNNPIEGVMDNLKIWNYAKTDFSDRYHEFPQGMVLKSDSIDLNKWTHLGMTWKQQDMVVPADAEGLILWNKLGSLVEVTNSEVGSDGLWNGSSTYSLGKWGNGIYSNNMSNYVQFSSTSIIDPRKCTVEMDIKTDFNLTNGTDGLNRHCLFYLRFSTFDYLSALFHDNWGLSLFTGWNTPSSGSAFLGTTDSRLTWSAGTLVHLAFVIDYTGIDGTLDTLRIYKGDELVGSSTDLILNTISTSDWFRLPWTDFGANHEADTVIDNVKIWDYAKTDFSDRFYEAPQEAVKKLYVDGRVQVESRSQGLIKEQDRQALLGSDSLRHRQSLLLYDKIYVGQKQLSDAEMHNLYLTQSIK